MALEGQSFQFNMGAVDAPTKMDISLDEMIKQVSPALSALPNPRLLGPLLPPASGNEKKNRGCQNSTTFLWWGRRRAAYYLMI